jgi:cystathionine beta-lyase/cystathionine gamma-synthase
LTKYINGHGDAMGGAVIGGPDLIDQIKLGPKHHIGGAISPFNAWLIMRGSVTLPLRRHCQNAHTIATSLAQDPRVSHVAYPGLPPTTPSTPGPPPNSPAATEAWSPSPSPARTSTASASSTTCGVITSAVSLGHDETLVADEHYPEARAAGIAPAFREYGLIRLAVGLESAEDLLADLDTALTTAYGPKR